MKILHSNIKSAFTLVEILVVVTIIGMLIAGAIASYSIATKQSRDTKRKTDLEQLKAALEVYKSVTNSYPSTTGWVGACSGFGGRTNDYIPLLVNGGYIVQLPHDPREGKTSAPAPSNCTDTQACYIYKSDGTDYKLIAFCAVELPISQSDPYYDSAHNNSFQVSSSQTQTSGWGP